MDNFVLIGLQFYFLLMNFTVERYYCHGPLLPTDSRFFVQETINFCLLNNRLFLERPEWMVSATCIHSYLFPLGYLIIIILTLSDGWRRFAVPILLFIGCKLNAILFYHYMEFTSSIPPENILIYFSVEGPYILSMAIVVVKVWRSLHNKEKLN